MSLTAKDKGGSFETVAAGVYQAVCYGVIDLGTHHSEIYNKSQEKLLILWELFGERMEDGRPFVVSRKYTNSLNSKATLRKDLESWRGKKFTDEQLDGFHLGKLIGANCQLNIVHKAGNEGKIFANIAAVMPITKGMAKIQAENPSIQYEIGEPIPANLPEWIKTIILESEEMQSGHSEPPISEEPHMDDDHYEPGDAEPF